MTEPVIEAVVDSIDSYPDNDAEADQVLPTDAPNDDMPGPSALPPREPSPDLPNLNRRPFPPDEASDDEEEEDEVVARLPIYLSPSLYPQIQLFQYPLHRQIHTPTWAEDRGKGITTRVKEGIGRVEVEIPVDAGPEVWRDERARELGFVADVNAVNGSGDVEGGYGFGGRGGTSDDKKKGKKKEKEKKEKWGEKMRLRSEPVPSVTEYYSGMIHDGALHLHPISKFVQLRTSLGYLDDYEQAQRDASARYRRGLEEGEEGDERKAKPAQRGKVCVSQFVASHQSLIISCRRTKTTTAQDPSRTLEIRCGLWLNAKQKTNGSSISGKREM